MKSRLFFDRSATSRTGKRQSGVAAVELAVLILPVILMVMMAVEYGRVMLTYNTLVKSVRLGARYLSQFEPRDISSTTIPPAMSGVYLAARSKAVNMIVYGKPSGGTSPVVPGLSSSNVLICDIVSGCSTTTVVSTTLTQDIDTVTVTITGYRMNTIFPGASQIFGFNFDDISATMRQN